MKSKIKTFFEPIIKMDKFERLKILLLTLCYGLIIGAFSILKPLKNPVFFSMVGKDWQPYIRFVEIPFIFICIFFYSKIVDKLRRYQILMYFLLTYTILNLVFAYIFIHPVYGLTNTATSPYRIVAWAFYFYLDQFQVFVVGAFWAFTSSISSPDSAKKEYGFVVAGSKIAGVMTPLLSLFWLGKNENYASPESIAILITTTSILLLLGALTIVRLKRRVPGYMLHGYEAAYQFEKTKIKAEETNEKTEEKIHSAKKVGLTKSVLYKIKNSFRGVFEGIQLMILEPYVFGIFIMVFGYEITSTILEYHLNILVSEANNNLVVGMSYFGLVYTAVWQAVGLIFALFGTTYFLKYFDVKICLLITPLTIIGMVVSLFFVSSSIPSLFAIMVLLRALNYGFTLPIREILYIPTVKDIKFKSKAWIDSFGRSFSKSAGSIANIASTGIASSSIIIALAATWAFVANLIGKKYLKTVANNEVIGKDLDLKLHSNSSNETE